ncbi:MAG TPA: glucokinase [Clostridiales bacterium]|nr:MAG: hypothetical protein A2Y22_05700 [Clostridiales bacterium GWD2_32_59]HAN10679.1 glucokinase [Clostridiales bacterium]
MYNIGIDIGGSKIAVGIVDESGNIVYKDQIHNDSKISSEREIKNILKEIKNVILSYNLDYSDINSIGVSFPGKVSKEGIEIAPNISMTNINLAKRLSRYIQIPIYVENDGNCAAVAEYVHGCLQGTKDSICVTLGTGFGGGIIIDGKLYTGANGGAAEFGHQVIIMDGRECGCGRHGCLEAYAPTGAWVNRIKEQLEENKSSKIYELIKGDIDKVNAKTIFKAIDAGDEFAIGSLKEHLRYVAIGIINLFQIFEPEVIAIGGGISGAKEKFLNPLLDEIDKQMKKCIFGLDGTKIKLAELGNDAGIIGAAELYRFK